MSSDEKNENNSTTPANQSRRQFLKYVAVGAVGVGAASAVEVPVLSNMLKAENTTQIQTQLNDANKKVTQLTSQTQQDQTQINNLQSQVTDLQSQIDGELGLSELSINEQKIVEAIVETIIPSDSNSPGAKEAGVIYFIDKQLAGDYGNSARMYMDGPFIQSGQTGPITVDGITYTEGTPEIPWQAAHKYQYNMTLRSFWRYGLDAVQNYANQILGKNFEDLSESDRVSILNDIDDNQPTDFNGIVPKDFLQEVLFMTWSGFFMDPMYGGNKGLVGWKLTGFTGANDKDNFNEGRDPFKLMVADHPTRLPPHSLGEFQKSLKIIGGT